MRVLRSGVSVSRFTTEHTRPANRLPARRLTQAITFPLPFMETVDLPVVLDTLPAAFMRSLRLVYLPAPEEEPAVPEERLRFCRWVKKYPAAVGTPLHCVSDFVFLCVSPVSATVVFCRSCGSRLLPTYSVWNTLLRLFCHSTVLFIYATFPRSHGRSGFYVLFLPRLKISVLHVSFTFTVLPPVTVATGVRSFGRWFLRAVLHLVRFLHALLRWFNSTCWFYVTEHRRMRSCVRSRSPACCTFSLPFGACRPAPFTILAFCVTVLFPITCTTDGLGPYVAVPPSVAVVVVPGWPAVRLTIFVTMTCLRLFCHSVLILFILLFRCSTAVSFWQILPTKTGYIYRSTLFWCNHVLPSPPSIPLF